MAQNSLKGLSKAIYLAKEHGASLSFVHVVHNAAKTERRITKEKGLQLDMPTFMLEAEMIAKKNSVLSNGRVLYGDPGHEIVEYTDTHDIGLIVIGARGLSTFKKIFLGSVSSYVMQKSKMAVMVVK